MRMDEYRDYGTIGDSGTPGVSVDTTRYGQVFQATHETYGHERLRLPFMKRSFISFSFGYIEDAYGQEVPKYIEDFNLIAVNSSDRWERDGYTTFEDRTSTYDNLDAYSFTLEPTNTVTMSYDVKDVEDGYYVINFIPVRSSDEYSKLTYGDIIIVIYSSNPALDSENLVFEQGTYEVETNDYSIIAHLYYP